MKYFLILISLFIFVVAEDINLLKPKNTVYDFTYDNKDATPATYKADKYVNKIELSVEKIIANFPRDMKIYSCQNDTYGNIYCPTALAKADSYWDYDNGSSTPKTSTVIDYANKVSDINFANANTTCARSTGSLIPESPANQWYISIVGWEGSNAAGFDVLVTKISSSKYRVKYKLVADGSWFPGPDPTAYCDSDGCYPGFAEGEGDYAEYVMNEGEVSTKTYSAGRDVTGFTIDLTKGVFHGLHPKTLGIAGSWDMENMPVCKSCGSNLTASQLTQTYLPTLRTVGWLLNQSIGGSSVSIELSADKRIYYYKIQAGTGAAKEASGTLTSTVSDYVSYFDGKDNYNINFNLTPTAIRVGQDGIYGSIYSFNTLVCYVSNSVCPGGTTATSGNETYLGQCKRTMQYTYYDYLCNSSLNEQYIPYTPTNVGGNCNKVDADKVNINNSLSNACNTATPPTNNCKRLNYSCNQNETKPALVDGEWKCSPYLCNGDKMCGYGTCLDKDISANEFMPSTMVPIKSNTSSASKLCNQNYEYSNGLSVQHFIKYCDAGEIGGATCLEYKNGNCYKFKTSNAVAKCTQTKTTCDLGFTKINGVCTKDPVASYSYYTYSCGTDTNSFNQKWELVNNKTSDPGCIDDTFGSCISFDKEYNNCRRAVYSCSLGGGCKLNSSSKWECTTGGSVETKCNGIICDLVKNNKVSYCVTGDCPKINGIYEVNGYCKIKSCPDDTFEVNGRCVKE